MAAYAALLSLMHTINDLQRHPLPPISLQKHQLHLLRSKLTFLQQFLEGYNPHQTYCSEADPLEIRITDAAHVAADVIETHIVDRITDDGEKMSSDDALYGALEKVIEEMGKIEEEAMAMEEGQHQQPQRNATPSWDSSSSSSIMQKSSTSMVGADGVLLEIKDKLTSHRGDLRIVPIVGMGGTGKTTLALNIYKDLLIKEHFDICAWATISQEYSIREMLAQVVGQLNQIVVQGLSEDDLGEKLYKHLYGRRYLIIMDDMWSIDAWDRIRNFFPNNNNGSRIVVTTRLSNLASTLSCTDRLTMELLDDEQSWELLYKTMFGEKDCPLELEEIGRGIGKSCQGLPLSIVVVGGLLANFEHTVEFWRYVKENLSEIVNSNDDERCLKILYMSYKQLPVHLKPCFLYMGVFSEDKAIRVSTLVRLWIAEGFLKPVAGRSLEEAAMMYLNDLINRNLVLLDKIGTSGEMKQSKMHDLLRDLCLREAEKERFYRTSCRGIANPTQPQPHSPIVIPHDTRKDEGAGASLSSHESKFQENVYLSINLRFLAFSPRILDYTFPRSILLFWNLKTLIVDYSGEIMPVDIWRMPHIRHVSFGRLHLLDPPDDDNDVRVLENLQTLGTIMNFRCSKQVVRRIPNITKMKLYFTDRRFCLTNPDYLEAESYLCRLGKLESLSCSFSGEAMNPNKLTNFPRSLKKLRLEIDGLRCWEEIVDKIGELPLLQKLKIQGGTFREGLWETGEGQFRSLKFLSIRECFLKIWTAESSHFPCLEHLVLNRVDNLEAIPLDFAEISTLRVMKMTFCRRSALESAMRILKEQDWLYGRPDIQVQVSSSRMDRVAVPDSLSPYFRYTN